MKTADVVTTSSAAIGSPGVCSRYPPANRSVVGLPVDGEPEVGIIEPVDALDVVKVEVAVVGPVGCRVRKELDPPPPQGIEGVVECGAPLGRLVHDAFADAARSTVHDSRSLKFAQALDQDGGADAR